MIKLLKRLFLKNKDTQSQLAKEKTNEIQTDLIELFTIHPNFQDLLWVENGPKANYQDSDEKTELFRRNGVEISIKFGVSEPSLIDMNQPIRKPGKRIEKLPYYPVYKELSPEQKYNYWLFLSNPYDPNTDIGHLFILYYGLERHMFKHNIEAAIAQTMALREIYDNASFQYYSGNAIILSCLIHQRGDLIQLFNESLKIEEKKEISPELYLLTLWSLKEELTAKGLMQLAKEFNFKKFNYIESYPDMFEALLIEAIYRKFDKKSFEVADIVSNLADLQKKSMNLFANISLQGEAIEIPNILSNQELLNCVYELLDTAHEKVKKDLAKMRKDNLVPTPKVKKKVKQKIAAFDYEKERLLIKEYEDKKDNVIDQHFVLISLADFYYKYRELNVKYLRKCMDYCYMDIELLKKIDSVYREEKRESLNLLKDRYSQDEYIRKLELIKQIKFNGRIPAFERLAIIYEKNKEYDSAIDIAKRAIQYYEERDMDVSAFEKRIERIKSKRGES